MNPNQLTLGCFSLQFEKDGKLKSLSYKDTGELLNQSDYQFDCGAERVYVPAGWDECFPTIDPFDDSPVMGDLIGTSSELSFANDAIVQRWDLNNYEAIRKFTLSGDNVLRVDFSVNNKSLKPIPFLWASHALFAVDSTDSVLLPDGTILRNFINDSTCRKWFVKNKGAVVISRKFGKITLNSDQSYWGIWLCKGGWPAGRNASVVCIGIEATTTDGEIPSGHLLTPNQIFKGIVNLTVELF